MGKRGELYSRRAFTRGGEITYFFNVKENHRGELYLNIVESSKQQSGFKRRSIMIFNENIAQFRQFFSRACAALANGESFMEQFQDSRRFYTFSVRCERNGKYTLMIREESEGSQTSNFRQDSIILRAASLPDVQPALEMLWSFIDECGANEDRAKE